MNDSGRILLGFTDKVPSAGVPMNVSDSRVAIELEDSSLRSSGRLQNHNDGANDGFLLRAGFIFRNNITETIGHEKHLQHKRRQTRWLNLYPLC